MTDFFPIVVTALAALAGMFGSCWPPIHGDSFAGLGGTRRHRDHGPRRVVDGGKPRRQTQEGHHRALIPIFTAIPIGVFGGVYALDVLPGVLLGLCLDSRSWHSLTFLTKNNLRAPPRLSTICDRSGALSGFTGAAPSAAGPPVLIYANGRLGENCSSKSTGHIFCCLNDFSYRAHHWRLL